MTVAELGEYISRRFEDLRRFAAAVLRRLGRPDVDPEDIVQKAILQVLRWSGLPLLAAGQADRLFFAVIRRECYSAARSKPWTGFSPSHQGGSKPVSPVLDDPEPLIRRELEEVELSAKQRRAFRIYWACDYDRSRALQALGLPGVEKEQRQEQAREYDQPLHQARKKIAAAMQPHRDLLKQLGAERFVELVGEIICGHSPEEPLNF